jgi:acyl-CoA thioester hydrolase
MKRKDTGRQVRFRPGPGPRPDFVRDLVTGFCWHQLRHRAIYADTDAARVVYHANYLRFFEMGRVEMMRAVGRTHRQIEELGYYHPIVDLEMHFFHPLRYDDEMIVHTRPGAVERVKVQVDYRITHAESGALSCAGTTVHACLRQKGLQPVGVDPVTLEMQRFFAELDG